jgi:chromosome segregation ATPase
VETAGAWSTLALRRPTAGGPAARAAPDSPEDLEALARTVRQATEAEAIRTALRNTLKEIAFTLGEATGTPAAQLNQILQLEKELRQLGEEQTLLSQQQNHLHLETDEYAAALTHLLQDTPGAPSASRATEPRRQAVQDHLDSLRQGRDRRLAAIDAERERCRADTRQREATLAEHYAAVAAEVNAHRAQAGASEHLTRLFQRLDSLSAQLEAVWEALG